ncbi:RNA-directed DNA polymerase (reverse transcriptase)-related family protein [Rhynchospora pubera]|uniref:RNA-directed DNA polymerase (Reverse transcriptase)-related family protein n=1 Tax=Rhynchospora pubera TaxID=906938 RepID=A0AAV8HST2_9POAL|nr:RNA-directed DNA polymerase (reverse transcriptase)-related family protein [Rhynchospora pubera]
MDMRAFFWDRGSTSRLSLVAWKTITTPKEQGGLGLKDLTAFNISLHMKALWAIISKSPAIWVSLVKAKYLSRATIWESQRTRKCTALWRALLGVRQVLQNNVQWQIGNGDTCSALGEPWHDMRAHYQLQNAYQRRLTVADLINRSDGSWNTTKLIEPMGFHGALYLAITFPHTPLRNNYPDKLIFTTNTNGQFTLEGAYRLLSGMNAQLSPQSAQMTNLLKKIWYSEGLQPKVRLFLWKVLKCALPLDQLFVYRFGKQPQGCSLCGAQQEDVTHTLFKCDYAWQVWLSSSLGLRSDAFPNEVSAIFTQLFSHFDAHQPKLFSAIIWNLWKQRCKMVFEGKKLCPASVNRVANSTVRMLEQALMVHSGQLPLPVPQQPCSDSEIYCHIDGSWVDKGFGGSGGACVN